jgi:hypothetical protein
VVHCKDLQLAGVVVLEEPFLALVRFVTLLHEEFVFQRIDGQTFGGGFVVEQFGIVVKTPPLEEEKRSLDFGGDRSCHFKTYLIALRPVARVQHDIGAGIVQARFVTTNFTNLGQHPVLKDGKIKENQNIVETISTRGS